MTRVPLRPSLARRCGWPALLLGQPTSAVEISSASSLWVLLYHLLMSLTFQRWNIGAFFPFRSLLKCSFSRSGLIMRPGGLFSCHLLCFCNGSPIVCSRFPYISHQPLSPDRCAWWCSSRWGCGCPYMDHPFYISRCPYVGHPVFCVGCPYMGHPVGSCGCPYVGHPIACIGCPYMGHPFACIGCPNMGHPVVFLILVRRVLFPLNKS